MNFKKIGVCIKRLELGVISASKVMADCTVTGVKAAGNASVKAYDVTKQAASDIKDGYTSVK